MLPLRFATTAAILFLSSLTLAFVAPSSPQPLAPGDMAPDFTLPGSDGRTYHLADYRGRQAVVLAWFAKAFSAG